MSYDMLQEELEGTKGSESGAARISLKKFAKLIHVQSDWALFYYFGNRMQIKGHFDGDCLKRVCEVLEQPTSVSELKKALAAFSESEIDRILMALEKARVLEQSLLASSLNSEPSEILQFFNHTCRTSSAAQSQFTELASKSVAILGHNEFASVLNQTLAALPLKSLKLCFQNELLVQDAADLVIVTSSWYRQNELLELNRRFLKEKRVWLPVLVDHYGGVFGPLFGTPDGPCFNCLKGRREVNMTHFDKQVLVENLLSSQPQVAEFQLSFWQKALAALVTTEAMKLLSGLIFSKASCGLYEYDFFNHRVDYHPVLPLPFCDHCSPNNSVPLQLTVTTDDV